MDVFLSSTLQIINFLTELDSAKAKKALKDVDMSSITIDNHDVLAELFEKAMTRGLKIFGEHAFRKSYAGKRRTPINKALFEVWGSILSKLTSSQFNSLLRNKKAFLTDYTSSYLKDYKFDEIISRNALKQSSVIERHSKLRGLINKYIND